MLIVEKKFFSENIEKYEENLNEVGFHSLLTFWDLIFKLYYYISEYRGFRNIGLYIIALYNTTF